MVNDARIRSRHNAWLAREVYPSTHNEDLMRNGCRTDLADA
jgi:hypothetical protein